MRAQIPTSNWKRLRFPKGLGYRRPSRTNQSVSASLLKTGYIAPIAVLNPFAGAAIVADFLLWGRDPLPFAQAQVLAPRDLSALTELTSAGSAPGDALVSAGHDPDDRASDNRDSDDRASDQFP